MKLKGQGIVEFILVIPFLIFLLLSIIELGIFWRTTQLVQQVALEAAIAGSQNYNMQASDLLTTTINAADAARDAVIARVPSFGISGITMSTRTVPSHANNSQGEPFVVYRYSSAQLNSDSLRSYFVLDIDFRNPVERGIIAQLTYDYRTLFFGLDFAVPAGSRITILPRSIPVSSTKVQEYHLY